MDVRPISSDFPTLPGPSRYDNRRVFRDHAFARRQQEGVLFAGAGVAIANDKSRIVDRFGNGQNLDVAGRKIADAIKIDHLPVGKEESVNGAIISGGKSHNLSSRVGSERATLSAAERPKIAHRAVGITKRVVSSCYIEVSRAGDTFGAVRISRAPDAAERAEIVHRSVGVEERVI